MTEETEDKNVEQIEATFGQMTAYVSGENRKDVEETFDHVWETLIETYNMSKDDVSESEEEQAFGSDKNKRTYG